MRWIRARRIPVSVVSCTPVASSVPRRIWGRNALRRCSHVLSFCPGRHSFRSCSRAENRAAGPTRCIPLRNTEKISWRSSVRGWLLGLAGGFQGDRPRGPWMLLPTLWGRRCPWHVRSAPFHISSVSCLRLRGRRHLLPGIGGFGEAGPVHMAIQQQGNAQDHHDDGEPLRRGQ